MNTVQFVPGLMKGTPFMDKLFRSCFDTRPHDAWQLQDEFTKYCAFDPDTTPDDVAKWSYKAPLHSSLKEFSQAVFHSYKEAGNAEIVSNLKHLLQLMGKASSQIWVAFASKVPTTVSAGVAEDGDDSEVEGEAGGNQQRKQTTVSPMDQQVQKRGRDLTQAQGPAAPTWTPEKGARPSPRKQVKLGKR